MKNIRLAYLKIKLPLVGNKCAFIYLASVYEEKKIIMLKFLQSICTPEGVFPSDLMGRMKDFCEADPALKAATKVRMRVMRRVRRKRMRRVSMMRVRMRRVRVRLGRRGRRRRSKKRGRLLM